MPLKMCGIGERALQCVVRASGAVRRIHSASSRAPRARPDRAPRGRSIPARRAATPDVSIPLRSGSPCPSGNRTPPARPCRGSPRRGRASAAAPRSSGGAPGRGPPPSRRRSACPGDAARRRARPSASLNGGSGVRTRKGFAIRSAFERLLQHARRERLEIQHDVGKLWHPQSPIPNPQSPIPNPQSPIPNPQSPIPNRESLESLQSGIRNPSSGIP